MRFQRRKLWTFSGEGSLNSPLHPRHAHQTTGKSYLNSALLALVSTWGSQSELVYTYSLPASQSLPKAFRVVVHSQHKQTTTDVKLQLQFCLIIMKHIINFVYYCMKKTTSGYFYICYAVNVNIAGDIIKDKIEF